ncbi:MAG: hypothetical protein LBU11_12040 [Zoogloeaceae bacterium]|jgi:hypothetical protein|nr:hypothetical protein [Zoogloeaceae bacterium]
MAPYKLFVLFFCLFVAPFAWADADILLPSDARFILPASAGAALLRQCSRATPTNVSGFWEPALAQIEELETRLTAYLAARVKSGEAVPPGSIAYHRQYVGIISDGARRIYGNFYPGEDFLLEEAMTPISVCDGGPAFWGIAYDIETKTFIRPDFNGSAFLRGLRSRLLAIPHGLSSGGAPHVLPGNAGNA